MMKIYDLLVIGGGISSCTLVSCLIEKGFKGNIAIIESGRGLGGRYSSRIRKEDKSWTLNHGAPNFNIINKSENKGLDDFISKLLHLDLIEKDDSLFFEIEENLKLNASINNIFYEGDIYRSKDSISTLSKKILDLNIKNNSKVDLFFQTTIKKLVFNNKKWIISSTNGTVFSSNYLVCSSNLLLHNRSKSILKTAEIPLRESIKKNICNEFDEIINQVNDQLYIKRMNFLIYTDEDYKYKEIFNKKNIHFLLTKNVEANIGFERIIFQKQKNNCIGIIVHSKNFEALINEFDNLEKINIKKIILERFNHIFSDNCIINKLENINHISIMRWRASQPKGIGVSRKYQLFEKYKLAFCGDWFDHDGFGRIEGAMISSIYLSDKIIDSI